MFPQAIFAVEKALAIRGNTPKDIPIVIDASLAFQAKYWPLPTLADLTGLLSAITSSMKEYSTSKVCMGFHTQFLPWTNHNLQEDSWLSAAICLEGLSKGFECTLTSGVIDHAGLLPTPQLRSSIYDKFLPIQVCFPFAKHFVA